MNNQAPKPRVALFEVCAKNHYGFVLSYIEVLRPLVSRITVFTDAELIPRLPSTETVHWVYRNPGESIWRFMNRAKEKEPFDYFFITTLQKYLFQFLFFFPHSRRVILCVHNANAWFVTNRFGLKGLVKFLIRRTIRLRVWAYTVSSNNMRQYIQSRSPNRKRVAVMPFGLRLENNQPSRSETERFTVVIPGMISTRRKSYEAILQVIPELPGIDFIFLGSPSKREGGQEVMRQLRELRSGNVILFEEFLPEEEFNRWILKADILYSEIIPEYRNDDYVEVYGVTKDTGLCYLMINYALPAVINSGFHQLLELMTSTVQFSNTQDLKRVFTELSISQERVSQLRANAIANAANFTPQAISEREFSSWLSADLAKGRRPDA